MADNQHTAPNPSQTSGHARHAAAFAAAPMRDLVAGAAAVPAAAAVPVVATPSPDADLIARAEAFLRFHIAKEAATDYLNYKVTLDWTAADHALWDSSIASATGYHDDMAEIAGAEPMTPEGAVAQAKVALWHFKAPIGDEEAMAWNLACTILRLQGVALPEWAA